MLWRKVVFNIIIWKNKNFKDLGIVVETTPKISKPKKKINIFEVPGRSGFMSVDDNTYESFTLSIECHAKETANFDDICEFLDGFGTLSLDGTREYTAIINNSIPFEQILMFRKFIVQFLVNPICEDINPTTFIVNSNNKILEINDTYYEIEPNITLECNGNVSITINGNSFHLENASGIYTLDCKNKVIIKDGMNASNIMIGSFPKLNKGKNNISYLGNVTSFKINYKKSYLWGVQT